MSETKVDILKELSHDSGVLTGETAEFAVQMERLQRAWQLISEKAEELEETIDGHLEELISADHWNDEGEAEEEEDEDEGNSLADYDLWALYRSTLNVEEVWSEELGEDVPLIKTDDAGQYVPVKRHVHQRELVDLERIALNLWLYNEDYVEESQGLSMELMQIVLREDWAISLDEDAPAQYDRHGSLKVA